jgi:predicted nucleic acid-binding protein
MVAGVDTGFFFALEEQNPTAIRIWKDREIITSSVVLFELQKKLLQGHFRKWHSIIDDIKLSISVIPINEEVALKAGHISHKYNIPGLDSLIIASLVEAKVKEIYTTDAHFVLYKGSEVKMINLA